MLLFQKQNAQQDECFPIYKLYDFVNALLVLLQKSKLYMYLFQRVFVWDLDETIIIFHSLLTSSYAQRYGKVSVLLMPLKKFLSTSLSVERDHVRRTRSFP